MQTTATTADTALDPRICRRARLSRDHRFDGEFFLAVRTTGIYCRPVCPARAAAEANVRYYRSAAQAARDGFRPCLRCRPESAPNSPAWLGTSTTVRRALQLIEQGALNEAPLAQLANRLGVGERYLRKLFQREVGVTPTAVAMNQRLLFAKKLLAETSLPITEVAFAAGFGSARRFNSAVRCHFGLPPTRLRQQAGQGPAGSRLKLQLHYRPPYDWEGVAAFFARHAVDDVEVVSAAGYRRQFVVADAPGRLDLRPLPGRHALELAVEVADIRQLMPIVARVRRMFDLDANPAAIGAVIGQDPHLRPLLRRVPGVRSPGHWSCYEAAARAIAGQQVSTRAARGVLARVAAAARPADGPGTFPVPAALATLDDACFRMPRGRCEALRGLGELCGNDEDGLELGDLAQLAGVGPWTTAMTAMRGRGHPDCLPLTDLGIARAWRNLAGDTALSAAATAWRPWRSYAANLLWRSLPS